MKDDITLINEVMDKIPNKYMAMVVAAKRAKALNQGAKPLVKVDAQKPTTLALYEIASGVIEPSIDKTAKDMLIIESDSSESVPTAEILIDDIDEIDIDTEIETSDIIDEHEDEIDSEDDEYIDDMDIDIPDEDIDLEIYDEDEEDDEVI
jgi:DNA-directed RNA polymerase subunit omega